jgi:sulfur-oxidizing protein SoxX
MGCSACHVIGDIEQLALDGTGIPPVKLGGAVARVKTYGDLVTSIINPSHKIARRYKGDEVMTEDGQSKMLNYNDVMTVTELVNLVTFLESNYDIAAYEKSPYPIYRP